MYAHFVFKLTFLSAWDSFILGVKGDGWRLKYIKRLKLCLKMCLDTFGMSLLVAFKGNHFQDKFNKKPWRGISDSYHMADISVVCIESIYKRLLCTIQPYLGQDSFATVLLRLRAITVTDWIGLRLWLVPEIGFILFPQFKYGNINLVINNFSDCSC